jgi:hypothetical protein
MSDKPVFSIQLVRDVVDCAYDGTSVRRTETATAQIIWDTPEGKPPVTPNGRSFAGEWRILG